MSDPSKFPFDSIPLNGTGTTTADPPRPAFSRSVPDSSASGLLPPTRKPVAVTVPEPSTAADPPAEPNPMAGTPPPKAGSVRSFLWDLVRPTRTKWAILAGGASLVAGAYGLNLVVPTTGDSPRTSLPTSSAKAGTTPQVGEERMRPPSVGEERATPVPPAKDTAPAPLPPFHSAPVPILTARAEAPVPVPVPIRPDVPPPSTTPPVPVPVPVLSPAADPLKTPPLPVVPPNDQTELPKVTGLPPVTTDPASAPLPVVKFGDLPPPVDPSVSTPKPVKPAFTEKPAEVVPKPVFVEATDPAKKADPLPISAPGTIKAEPLPLVVPPKGDPEPVGEVKMPPFGDTKPPLPPPGTQLPPVNEAIKPIDPAPVPKPVFVDPTLTKPAAVPVPLFTEEKPTAVPTGVAKEVPSAVPGSGPPPKKGFEVDVVKVRATDTYTSISEAFYQSRKYATSLRAFNGDVDISRLQEVEVPPLFELQKFTGVPAREAEPTGGRTVIPARGGVPTEPAVRGPVLDPTGDAGESLDWGPQGKKRPVIKYERFTTPKEGMTPRDVARAVYDDESQWPKLLAPRGGKMRADDPLPRGTELTVPREELPWK